MHKVKVFNNTSKTTIVMEIGFVPVVGDIIQDGDLFYRVTLRSWNVQEQVTIICVEDFGAEVQSVQETPTPRKRLWR